MHERKIYPKFKAGGIAGELLSFTETDVEIIGNIYENPDLIN